MSDISASLMKHARQRHTQAPDVMLVDSGGSIEIWPSLGVQSAGGQQYGISSQLHNIQHGAAARAGIQNSATTGRMPHNRLVPHSSGKCGCAFSLAVSSSCVLCASVAALDVDCIN